MVFFFQNFEKNKCIILTVLWCSTLMQKKWSNGSKDIAICEIKQSDWLRGFSSKTRKQEFSQIWGLHRNHKTLF